MNKKCSEKNIKWGESDGGCMHHFRWYDQGRPLWGRWHLSRGRKEVKERTIWISGEGEEHSGPRKEKNGKDRSPLALNGLQGWPRALSGVNDEESDMKYMGTETWPDHAGLRAHDKDWDLDLSIKKKWFLSDQHVSLEKAMAPYLSFALWLTARSCLSGIQFRGHLFQKAFLEISSSHDSPSALFLFFHDSPPFCPELDHS